MPMIATALSRVRLDAPRQFGNLTLYPLVALQDRVPGYLLLDDALGRGLARVTEVSDRGSVPELLFLNEAGEDVLLVDGEELVGAKQNRILNTSILVGARQTVAVPVSCVEQGRWAWRSRNFSSGASLFARARAKKMRRVSESLRRTGSYASHQGEIWDDVQHKLSALKVHSGTASMDDAYRGRAADIEQYVQALQPAAGETGAVFAVDGAVAGLDLFDSAAAFRALMQKLVRSYAMDAIETPVKKPQPSPDEAVRQFLDDMMTAALQRFPGIGKGEQLRLESANLAGSALVADGRIVHLCAFRSERSSERPSGLDDAGGPGVPPFQYGGQRNH